MPLSVTFSLTAHWIHTQQVEEEKVKYIQVFFNLNQTISNRGSS